MKSILIASALILASIPQLPAQTLIDSFGGTSVNSANWQVRVPFADSSVVEGGGVVSLTNRGQLLSQIGFGPIMTITGQFDITGSDKDQFSVMTRTDGVATSPFVVAEFDNDIRFAVVSSFDNGSTANNIEIKAIQNFTEITGVAATMPINVDQVYNFKITDDGTLTSFFIGDMTTPVLSLSFSGSFGDLVGFENREGIDGGSFDSAGSVTQLSDVEIASVPEPATWGLLSGILALAGAVIMRKKRD